MLLEFQTFLLILTLLLPLLAVIAARGSQPKTNDYSDGPRDKPKVVTLGFLQSFVNFCRFVCNPSIPNYELFAKINEIFGGVVLIRHPFRRQVALFTTDMSVAKPILSSSAWQNRFPEDHYFHDLLDKEPAGLLFSHGGHWKQGRRLVLKLLQQFGFFREEVMDKIVQSEARELLEKEIFRKIRQQGGEAAVIPMNRLFQIYTLNVVFRVILGKRFEQEDPKIQSLVSTLNAVNEKFNGGTTLLDVFPWLWHLPFFRFYRDIVKFNILFKEYFQNELIEPRRRSGSYKRNPVDFVDNFLLEIDNRAGDDPCYLNDLSLTACMRDIFLASADTTNSSLEHGILHVCLQPAIQRKVQEEIDQVIGTTREPCYKDRKRMPYTQAVLNEILRHSTPIAIVSRCPVRDQVFQGQYEIPKDSTCAINLFAMHRSEQVWMEPEKFRPARFLNNQNELINLDKIMPFGFGKRHCPGEFAARMSLFIFFVSLLQKFTFKLSTAHGPPCMKNKIGLSHGPFPYHVKVSERKRGEGCESGWKREVDVQRM